MFKVSELISMEVNREDPGLYDISYRMEHYEQMEASEDPVKIKTATYYPIYFFSLTIILGLLNTEKKSSIF